MVCYAHALSPLPACPQANSEALAAVPPGLAAHTLQYQLLHLRLALDEVAAQLAAEAAGGEDAMALLVARQRLRGRDRRGRLPRLGPSAPADEMGALC